MLHGIHRTSMCRTYRNNGIDTIDFDLDFLFLGSADQLHDFLLCGKVLQVVGNI